SARGRFAVVNADTGRRLAARDGGLVLEADEGEPDEGAQWMMSTTGDGTWTFVNVATGGLVDADRSAEDGAPVTVNEPTAGASQRWAVVDETVLGVQDVEAYTVPGMEPELPSTVTPVYRDGPRGELEVS